MEQVKNERTRSELDTITNLKLQQTKDMLSQKLETQSEVANTRADAMRQVQTLKDQTVLERQKADLEHQREVDDLKRQIAEAKNTTTQRGQDVGAKARIDAAQIATNRTYEFEVTKNLRDVARAKGDTEGETLFNARLDKLNHEAVSSGEAMMQITGAAPAKPSTMAQPQSSQANTISVDGKPYPVFKDKTGNRAYLKDGKYIPIP